MFYYILYKEWEQMKKFILNFMECLVKLADLESKGIYFLQKYKANFWISSLELIDLLIIEAIGLETFGNFVLRLL